MGSRQSRYFSCIKVNGKIVSVSYNLRAADTIFNLQSGFEEAYDKKLSLGTLHMGISIEEAFSDEGICVFDMLAGGGKSEFYKRKYAGETVEFITLQVTRNKYLKIVRSMYDILPDNIKRLISKMVSLFRG